MTEVDRTVELFVNGMTCGHCVASVTEELEEVPGVKNVEVILGGDDKPSKVTVVTDILLDDEALRDAISEAGYQLTEIRRDI
ncbi:heavy-metal-associated domain-containing protein [Actinomycetaceae bacterium MB13-C1-2]|nr:heavy-metal-associated domain-containing protein [Actinomycetaceae bacterium MB13-C1-2]